MGVDELVGDRVVELRVVGLITCEMGEIVQGDEGPVSGVEQVVCHGVKVVGVHEEEGQEEGEVQGEVEGEVEQLRDNRTCAWREDGMTDSRNLSQVECDVSVRMTRQPKQRAGVLRPRACWCTSCHCRMSKRKRNKKRKKKLPKTSSSCGRARRRQRQWHARDAGFPGDVSPRAVLPSVDDRPKMLDIMAVTEQKYSYVLLICKVGFPGNFAPRAVFLSLFSGPRCSASWPVWTRRILACARLGLLVFDDVFRAVLLLVVSSPRCPSSWAAWTTGQLCGGSQVQLLDEVVVPLCATTYALVQLFITLEVPQVQLIIKVMYIPVATQSLIPMALTVHQTIEISRLQFLDKELTCPLLGHTGASWCSTGAALGQGCRARCVHDKCPDPVAQYSGKSAVAVPLQGLRGRR